MERFGSLIALLVAVPMCFGITFAVRQDDAQEGAREEAQADEECERLRLLEERVINIAERLAELAGRPVLGGAGEEILDGDRAFASGPLTSLTRASWRFEMQNGQVFSGGDTADETPEGLTLDTRAGPFVLTVIWDDFDGAGTAMPPTPTVFLHNSVGGVGIARWKSAKLNVAGWSLDLGKNGCMLPRYAFVDSKLTLEHWKLVPQRENVPAELRQRALNEIENAKQNHVGPYKLWWAAWLSTPSSWHAIAAAPYHAGSQDWLACPEGYARRWAEAMGAACLGLWLSNDDGSPWDPGEHFTRYWWDASQTQYAYPPWRWSPSGSGWCAYEMAIADRPLADQAHFGAIYKAAFALAKDCRAARHIAKATWLEIRRTYSMDPRVPGTDPSAQGDDLYSPLWQVLQVTAPGGKNAPPAWSGWGTRATAHAVMVACEWAPYMTAEERELYLTAFARLLAQLDDGRGVLDRSYGGDAASAGLPAPVALCFQQQLMHEAAEWLAGLPEGAACKQVPRRIVSWWGENEPYFAHTGPGFKNAQAAPHKGQAYTVYSLFTRTDTWGGFGSFEGVVADTKTGGLDECSLDCVPPTRRTWN